MFMNYIVFKKDAYVQCSFIFMDNVVFKKRCVFPVLFCTFMNDVVFEKDSY